MTNEVNLSAEELKALVDKLTKQVTKLETKVADLQGSRPVPKEDLVVIAAAAAAYMGYKGKIKAIQFAGRDRASLAA